MSSLHTEREVPEEEYQNMSRRHDSEPDREISLNTSTILLIFFALALVCAVFFGFGYTMGRKSTPPTTYAASEDHTQSLRDAFKSFKPSPGGASPDKNPTAKAATPAEPESSSNSVVVPASTPVTLPAHNNKPIFDPDAQIVTESTPAKLTPPAHSSSTPPAAPTVAPTGTVIVQVAAVSHQEDADTMLAALKRKGYSVAIHNEPQDRLLHLQLGPYASKKDAEAMRTRLLADGYNSILK